MIKLNKLLFALAILLQVVGVQSAWAQWAPDGMAICTADSSQDFPLLISDSSGGAIIVWRDYRSSLPGIYAQRIDANGSALWAAGGVAIGAAPGDEESRAIAPDGAGGAIIVWHDFIGGYLSVFAQRVNASGVVQWTPGGVLLCTAAGNQGNPRIISDDAGGAVVSWMDDRSGNWDIYAQRVNASGSVQWSPTGVALCTANGDQGDGPIVSDGAGGAIVAWYDGRSSNPGVYVRRVNSSGTPLWTSNGVLLCTPTNDEASPQIASDGSGGAIVTWEDYRTGTCQIYARRVNASGTPQWTSNGVLLCTVTALRFDPKIASDGAGGAIVAWEEYRAGADVYAQRINASGALEWASDGVPICATDDNQWSPQIIPDGVGEAIVTWTDDRGGSKDIYAQRVNASGGLEWTPDGVSLCTATGDQNNQQIVSDGAGGAIVTWNDARDDSADIYAQRINSDGVVPLTGADVPTVSMSLHQNFPNPFNPSTEIRYYLPGGCSVALDVYGVDGALVARLTEGYRDKGSHVATWNGRDRNGRQVSSGVYFYRLRAGTTEISKKMVLAR